MLTCSDILCRHSHTHWGTCLTLHIGCNLACSGSKPDTHRAPLKQEASPLGQSLGKWACSKASCKRPFVIAFDFYNLYEHELGKAHEDDINVHLIMKQLKQLHDEMYTNVILISLNGDYMLVVAQLRMER